MTRLNGVGMDGKRGRPGDFVVLAGIGVLAGGVVLVLYAWLFGLGAASYVEGVPREERGDSGSAGLVGGIVIIAGAATVARIMVLRWRHGVAVDGRWPEPFLRAWLGWPAVIMAGAGVWAVLSWRALVARGLPGEEQLLVLAACWSVPVGCALVLLGAPREPRRMSRLRSVRGGVAFTAGVLVVALGAGAAVVIDGDHTRVVATTAGAVAVPAAPADATTVRWRWRHADVDDVVAAGAGVVVATPDGVVALDGRTGDERWRYRRTDVKPKRLTALDGGRAVAADFGGWLHVLDAVTGEVWWRLPPGRSDGELADVAAAGDTLVAAPEPTVVAGFDVRTGDEKWEYPLADGCRVWYALGTAGAVVLEQECADGRVAVAVDTGTGERLWTREDLDAVDAVAAGKAIGCTQADQVHVVDLRGGRTTETGGRCHDRVLFADLAQGQYLTEDGLFRLGETDPTWSLPPENTVDPLIAGATGDLIALLSDVTSAGDTQPWLTVLDRHTGRERRVFDEEELAVRTFVGVELLVAPGAVVVRALDGDVVGHVLVGLG